MRGDLRWPNRPFQVTCVLVAVLPTAALSLLVGVAGPVGATPILFHEHLGADTMAIVSGSSNALILPNPAHDASHAGGRHALAPPASVENGLGSDHRRVPPANIDSGNQASHRAILARQRVQFWEVSMCGADALGGMRPSQLAAALCVVGEPADAAGELPAFGVMPLAAAPIAEPLWPRSRTAVSAILEVAAGVRAPVQPEMLTTDL
jgi:hypothetical protein